MDELIKEIQSFRKRLDGLLTAVKIAEKENQLGELERAMEADGFWNDRARAEKISKEASRIREIIHFWHGINKNLHGVESLAAEDVKAKNVTLLDELTAELKRLEDAVLSKEVELLFSDKHDTTPAIVTVYSGAGGVDAQDWAQMLERMYVRFSDRMKFKASILGRTPGQEAGIKNVTIRIEGPYAYGYLKAESGVHRLVRLSPFDSDGQRHTSFAMVEVLPELEETTTVEVSKDDVRIDVFRSSGHGGQSVNTTDSAVRLTHIPTGIVVSCQNERSQLQNKEQAWKVLLGKLERYYAAQKEEEKQLLRGEFTEAAWGNQIRSYVVHPYKMVKDHRTKFESKNPDMVLDGELLPFIETELRRRVENPSGH